MFELEIGGLDQMRKRFAESPRVVGPILGEATKKAGIRVQSAEIREAPHRTGALQRSIRLEYVPIVATITPTISYARYVHGPTRPHPIAASRAKALRFVAKDGSIVFRRSVRHPGTQGNPFVKRTVEQEAAGVDRIFSVALQDIITKLSS